MTIQKIVIYLVGGNEPLVGGGEQKFGRGFFPGGGGGDEQIFG